jgi:hypothetical protein
MFKRDTSHRNNGLSSLDLLSTLKDKREKLPAVCEQSWLTSSFVTNRNCIFPSKYKRNSFSYKEMWKRLREESVNVDHLSFILIVRMLKSCHHIHFPWRKFLNLSVRFPSGSKVWVIFCHISGRFAMRVFIAFLMCSFCVSVQSWHLVVKACSRIPVKTLRTNYRYRTFLYVSIINRCNWGAGVHLDYAVQWFSPSEWFFSRESIPCQSFIYNVNNSRSTISCIYSIITSM